MKRLLIAAGLFAVAAFAISMVSSMKSFDALYDIKTDSELGKSKCLPCHATAKGGKVLNAYGKDLQSAMKAKGTKKLTEDIMRGVEKSDSDKDGMSNLDEIKADRNPGEK